MSAHLCRCAPDDFGSEIEPPGNRMPRGMFKTRKAIEALWRQPSQHRAAGLSAGNISV
jgi:hypothetical protein